MNALLILLSLVGYHIGQTFKVPLQRIGITLTTQYVNAVCVDTVNAYTPIFAVYDSVVVHSIVNPMGVRLVVGTEGKIYQTTNLESRKWAKYSDNVPPSVHRIVYYPGATLTSSRWYFLAPGFFLRGQGFQGTDLKVFTVVDEATGDSGVPVLNVAFHPVYQDSFLYVATGKGVFLGIGNTPGPFYSWTWHRIPGLEDTVYTVMVDSSGGILAGTPTGLYKWDPTSQSWSQVLSGVVVNDLYRSSATGDLYALTTTGLYRSSDEANWTQVGDPETNYADAINLGDSDTLLLATRGDGIFKYSEVTGQMTPFSQGIADRFYRYIGGLDVRVLSQTQSGLLFAGTAVGLFEWTGDRWVNVAGSHATAGKNQPTAQLMGWNVSTEVLDSAIAVLREKADSAYEWVRRSISERFNVPGDLVYPDVDGEPGVNILIAPVVEFISQDPSAPFIADYSPLIGYFNPADETDTLGTLKDFFVVNISTAPDIFDGRFLNRPSEEQWAWLLYLFSRMAFYQADTNEVLPIQVGLSLLNVFWIAEDTLHTPQGDLWLKPFIQEGLEPGLEYATDFNSSLLRGSVSHPVGAVEIPEAARERMLLFTDYLYERFGMDFIENLATDPRNGLHSLTGLLEEAGTSFEEVFRDWVFTNFYDAGDYAYNNFDVHVTPVEVGAGKQSIQVLPYSVYYIQSTEDTASGMYILSFNGQDGSEVPVYRLEDTPVLQEMEGTSNVFHVSTDASQVWVVVNPYPTAYQFAAARDATAPEEVEVYAIQNAVFNPIVNFYVYGNEELFADVGTPPVLTAYNLDTDAEATYATLLDYTDSVNVYLYHTYVNLNNPGTYVVSALAGDEVGNWATVAPETLGVLVLQQHGGQVELLNGAVRLEYAPGAVASEVPVVVSRVPGEVIRTRTGVAPVAAYSIGSAAHHLAQPATLSFRVPNATSVSLYRLNQDHLEPLTFWKVGDRLETEVSSLGIFVVAEGSAGSTPLETRLYGLSRRVFPRAQDLSLKFTLARPAEVAFHVYNVAGQQIFRLTPGTLPAGLHRLTLPVSQFPAGLYFVTFEVNHRLIQSERLILQ